MIEQFLKKNPAESNAKIDPVLAWLNSLILTYDSTTDGITTDWSTEARALIPLVLEGIAIPEEAENRVLRNLLQKAVASHRAKILQSVIPAAVDEAILESKWFKLTSVILLITIGFAMFGAISIGNLEIDVASKAATVTSSLDAQHLSFKEDINERKQQLQESTPDIDKLTKRIGALEKRAEKLKAEVTSLENKSNSVQASIADKVTGNVTRGIEKATRAAVGTAIVSGVTESYSWKEQASRTDETRMYKLPLQSAKNWEVFATIDQYNHQTRGTGSTELDLSIYACTSDGAPNLILRQSDDDRIKLRARWVAWEVKEAKLPPCQP